jgi:nitrilase
MNKFKLAAIQMQIASTVESNLELAAALIKNAAKAGAQCIVLPEMFVLSGYLENKLKAKEPLGNGPIQAFLAEQAKTHAVWIVGGTIPLAVLDSTKVRAACLVFNDQGLLAGRYDKIHLFDVTISGRDYRESAFIEAGKELTVIETPFGRLGLAVCYDLRFPELFRALFNHRADLIAIPAAFTAETGKAHWDLLCRCRAIENQVYLIAAAQTRGLTEKKTYGHSLIVDPWGEKLAALESDNGFAIAEMDLKLLHQIRLNMPVQAHQRIFNTQQLSL